MSEWESIFEASVSFDPAAELEGFLRGVPGKWVVYLMVDEGGRPVQLLCVRNLKASLKRRLGGEETIGVSKRVNYRELVRRVYWRRVDSAFEADWVYLEAAREIFPETYEGMVGFRAAWFVHVDPGAEFPRYVKTTDLVGGASGRGGVLIGPVEDKHAAHRLIEIAEGAFDLCRYYNVLVQSPAGRACAYKEMGKCPAPCDGTISMEAYRGMVGESVAAVVEPGPFVREQEARMKRLAGELEFERAGKVKGLVEQVSQLGKGAFRHAKRLKEFAFMAMQRGPRERTAKVFLIVRGEVEEVVGLISEPVKGAEVLMYLLEWAEEMRGRGMTKAGVERIGLVSQHLFSAKQTHGVFIRLDGIEERSVAKGYRELGRQKVVEESEGEGVVKELQAM